jgi:error-prone DNA polymerase
MGFYAPDSLVHEAQRRGIPVLGLDVNASQVLCTVERSGEQLGVRLGLGYVKGAVAAEVSELVAERERGGPFADLGDLAARTATRRGTLEQLAWSGACEAIAGGRREALWQLGLAAGGQATAEGLQLALPVELPETPSLRELDRWQRLLADYATSGVSAHDHAMAALRSRLRVPADRRSRHLPRMGYRSAIGGADPVALSTSAQLARMPHGCTVAVAGLVIARQRPGTAKGTMFLLFEDEWGVVNLIVPKAVYEAHRALARAEPLLLARGRLERRDGVTNLIVRELAPLERLLAAPGVERGGAGVSRLPQADRPARAERDDRAEEEGAGIVAGMRAVAPPVQSFASGRRR